MTLPSWINLYGRIFISVVTLVCATEVMWYSYLKYRCYRRKNINKYVKPKTEVFFFSENSSLCRQHLISNQPCTNENCPVISVNKLTAHLLSARRQLDICVYFLSFSALINKIIKLQKQNVFIRVITDDESQDNDTTQILNLRKAGIQIRTKKSAYLMHHKFAIVDKKVLITGSANWTLQAFFGNCENLIITNQCEIVSAYNHEFEKLWSRFDYDTEKYNKNN